MDAAFEKDLMVTKLKAMSLNNRAQALLALAELVNEYAQLVAAQQKQADTLVQKIKSYEDKTVGPDGGPVPSTPRPVAI